MGFVVGDRSRWWGSQIPFRFDSTVVADQATLHKFYRALKRWQELSPIQLLDDSDGEHEDHILLVADRGTGGGSSESTGKAGKEHVVRVDADLSEDPDVAGIFRFDNVLLHELGHAAGLVHEHQRPDRSEHIADRQVPEWDGAKRGNVALRPHDVPVGPYDCNSLMHYFDVDPYVDRSDGGCGAFSNYYGLSPGDVHALRYLAGHRYEVVRDETLDEPWTHLVSSEFAHHDYLVLYARGEGTVGFERVLDHGDATSTWGGGTWWFDGWDRIITLEVLGARLLLVYDGGTGDVRIDRLAIDPSAKTMGTTNLWDGGWKGGWTHVEACGAEGFQRDHVLVYDAADGTARLDAVNRDPEPGKGTTNRWERAWTAGYDTVMPFRLRRDEWHVLLYDRDTGGAEVVEVTRSGSKQVDTHAWAPGWTHFVPYPQHGEYYFPTWRDRPVVDPVARIVAYDRSSGAVHFDLLSPSGLTVDGEAAWDAGYDVLLPYHVGRAGRYALGRDGLLAYRHADRRLSYVRLT